MKHKLKKSERGDTLIEVFIAITMIGVLLTGAYLVNRNSILAERSSQEHTEALQLLEGQIEAIRADTQDITPLLSTPYSNYYCMVFNSSLISLKSFPGPDDPHNPLNSNLTIANAPYDYPPNGIDTAHSPCVVNSSGEMIPMSNSEQALYHLSFYIDNNYTVHLQAIWNAITSSTNNSVKLSYQLQ